MIWVWGLTTFKRAQRDGYTSCLLNLLKEMATLPCFAQDLATENRFFSRQSLQDFAISRFHKFKDYL